MGRGLEGRKGKCPCANDERGHGCLFYMSRLHFKRESRRRIIRNSLLFTSASLVSTGAPQTGVDPELGFRDSWPCFIFFHVITFLMQWFAISDTTAWGEP